MSRRARVMTIFGTRPEAIKMAPVIAELSRRPDRFECVVVVTGQHREMLDQVLALFQIQPAVDLSIMTERQTLEQITSRALVGLAKVYGQLRPDLVLVQGDTTTTFVAALAAFYAQIPVGHVEAGLRTGNIFNPFPEEMNRRLTSALTEFHFAPTEQAKRNLLAEGIPFDRIHLTGNTVIDALRRIVQQDYVFEDPQVARIDFHSRRVLVLTTHRRESFGVPMTNALSAIRSLVKQYSDIEVVFPVHRNPNVRETAGRTLNGDERIHLVEPMEYLPFVHLMNRSYLILTDSGGIQEEAPSLGKPVLVLRETTERPEGIEAGTARLVGTSPERIVTETASLLDDPAHYRAMANAVNPYGDGHAAERIADVLSHTLLR